MKTLDLAPHMCRLGKPQGMLERLYGIGEQPLGAAHGEISMWNYNGAPRVDVVYPRII